MWREIFDEPRMGTTLLTAGERIEFSLLAVPERAICQPRMGWQCNKRGRRVPLTDDGDVRTWFSTRLAGLDEIEVNYEPEPVWSQALGHTWRAVKAKVGAVVVDPVAVSMLMVGRSRAYGFGLPVFG